MSNKIKENHFKAIINKPTLNEICKVPSDNSLSSEVKAEISKKIKSKQLVENLKKPGYLVGAIALGAYAIYAAMEKYKFPANYNKIDNEGTLCGVQ